LKTLNICHIITTSELGGAQLSTYRILKELARQPNLKIFLIYGKKGPLCQEFDNLERVTVFRFKNLHRKFNPLHDFFALIDITRTLKNNNIHIIHTHSSKASLIGRLAGIYTGIKIIHTYHGFGHDFFLNKYLRSIYILIEKILNYFSHQLIFICQNNLDQALRLKLVSKKKSVIIPDTLSLHQLQSVEHNLKSFDCTVGSVLSFKEQKQPFQMLKLIKMLNAEFTQIHFILIGEGPLLKLTQIKAQELNIKNITFTGAKKDIGKYYQKLNLFIHTSRYEGFSMAQIEALYLKIPIVVTDQGGIRDILEHGKQGFIYKDGDLESAFQYCKIILNGSLVYKPLDKSHFDTWNTPNILEKHLRLYNQLVSNNLRSAP